MSAFISSTFDCAFQGSCRKQAAKRAVVVPTKEQPLRSVSPAGTKWCHSIATQSSRMQRGCVAPSCNAGPRIPAHTSAISSQRQRHCSCLPLPIAGRFFSRVPAVLLKYVTSVRLRGPRVGLVTSVRLWAPRVGLVCLPECCECTSPWDLSIINLKK